MNSALWFLLFIAAAGTLTFRRCRLQTATAVYAALLALWTVTAAAAWWAALFWWALYVLVAAVVNRTAWRRRWLISPALNWFRKKRPRLSPAEHTALEAGTLWWEEQLFSGMPDWSRLDGLPLLQLRPDEQAFMAGPLQELLERAGDISPLTTADVAPGSPIWQHLVAHGFFGLSIPVRYGGLEFSPHARSRVLARIASCPDGATLGPLVATPGALGPAQLLLVCGTDQQKAGYLPRLAAGEDIPCFALTSTQAGTDTAAMTDTGIICTGMYNGEQVTGIRLNWHKRHIMLAPVATLIGLAVRILDPDNHLERGREPGITCLLVPADLQGVQTGHSHDPMGAAFPYGTTEGVDVFVPLDAVIGGPDMIGRGWQLIMDQLPIGRALSLPSAAAGFCARTARLAGAYCRIRFQFDRPIGAFEGIEELLARLGAHAYACEAVRQLNASAVHAGERPTIAASIAKYHTTTRAQAAAVDSMTLHAGKAVCDGPANPFAAGYRAAPLNATADGTNVFTRSTLIFGQGGIRCHPFLQAELAAANRPDRERAVAAFDAVFPAHMGHFLSLATRALILGISQGRGSDAGACPDMRRYCQRINRYAAALAVIADLCMATLGDNLRYRGNLSARLGDVLSQLYIASAVVHRYRVDGAHRQDLAFAEWTLEDCFATIEDRLAGILQHLPRRPLAWLARVLIFPLGRHAHGADDDISHRVATILQTPGETRDRLTRNCHHGSPGDRDMALFDTALQAVIDTVPLRKRLRRARSRGEIDDIRAAASLEQACTNGLLTAAEMDQLRKTHALQDAVTQVDDFPNRDAASATARNA